MFGIRSLHQRGVLGINRRNAEYILRYNSRHLYPVVDNKLQTKSLALAAGISVPKLYTVIHFEHELSQLESKLAGYDDFVIKPARGSRGDGILVITGRVKNRFRKGNGPLLFTSDLEHHVSNILSGMYSLGGQADEAMVEYRVQSHPMFDEVSYQGVPDIRVICFLGYPVMAMLRLPTRISDGKANLHQGALGTGVDIGCGRTLGAVWHNEPIDHHPDTLNTVGDLTIPNWPTILKIVAGCYELTGLGYIGVDMVIDKHEGPMILELNARPGLNIQIANSAGLVRRLKLIESHFDKEGEQPVDARIAFAMEHFAISTG